MNRSGRLIVVSNRLPVTVEGSADAARVRPSDGGLVSALVPVLRDTGGTWVGWPGTADRVSETPVKHWCASQEPSLAPVFLSADDVACFYDGFANQILWPLLHGFSARCEFNPKYWSAYRRVNQKFAATVAEVADGTDLIWVHDYHLMLLGQELRTAGVTARLAYFHHVPFPSVDIFEKLPWRLDLLRALMYFDTLGFQTDRDRRNFVDCVRFYLMDSAHLTRAFTFPISVDYQRLAADAARPAVISRVDEIRVSSPNLRIILGLDRLDYTKGIPERLAAFHMFLARYPEFHGRVTLFQVVIPSRQDVREYEDLRLRIEALVSRTNGEFGRPGWVPVQYFYRSIERTELLSMYRAAAVALVTPLKDGMNLVAKEFCSSRTDNEGVLVLSEFAGAARELGHGALLVNPHDVVAVADTVARALRLPESERQARMKVLRAQIRKHDVFHWARSICRESAGKPVAVAENRQDDTRLARIGSVL